MDCPEVGGLQVVKGNSNIIIKPGPREKVLVIEFWATWCGPCRTTIPHLTELQKKFAASVEMIGITNESVDKVMPFVNSMGSKMEYTVAIDGRFEANTRLMAATGARGIPHAFIVNTKGKVVFAGHPADPQFESALQVASAEVKVDPDSNPNPNPNSSENQSGGNNLVPLPAIKASKEELMAMPVKELKKILTDRGLSITGLLEKGEFVSSILQNCVDKIYYRSE